MSYAEHLLGSIFCLDHLHDFQLVCGRDGQRINVHRNVIEAACTKFYSMAQNDSLRSEIILHDVNGELMQTTIDFIYSGHIELSLSNARDIIYVASVLGIISLEEKCAQFLITNLSLDNCLATMTTAVNCNKFDLFAKSWKLMCEGFGHLPFLNLTLLSNSNQIGNNSNVNAVEDVISCHMMQCFKLMESDHLQHIPHALESIRLKHIPSNFLRNVLAPLLIKHNLMDKLLKEYHRRTSTLPTPNPIPKANASALTAEKIYCAHYSSNRKSLIVQRYNLISNDWEEVTALSCVTECVRYVYNKRKLFIVADQDCVRIVESFDSDSFDRTVYSRIMPWRAGFRLVAVDGYIYVFGGVGWHADENAASSIGSLERFHTKNCAVRIGIWETREPMPVKKFRFVAAESDGRIYVAGGDNDGKFSDQFYCYDTNSDEWTEKASIRLQSTNAVLFKSNKILYAIGAESILHRYNSEEDYWREIGPFREDEKIIHTTEYCGETYAICNDGKFGIIEIEETGGHLNRLNEMPVDFDPFHPPMLFVN